MEECSGASIVADVWWLLRSWCPVSVRHADSVQTNTRRTAIREDVRKLRWKYGPVCAHRILEIALVGAASHRELPFRAFQSARPRRRKTNFLGKFESGFQSPQK